MGQEKRLSKWYFGGLAVTGAATCTHPLDTIKTLLQTPHPTSCANPHFKGPSIIGQPKDVAIAVASRLYRVQQPDGTMKFKQMGLVQQTATIVRARGILSLYRGLPACCLWTLTSATTRFGIYDVWKQKKNARGEPSLFYQRVYMSIFGGSCAAIVGNAPDIVKIRMQNDLKLPGTAIRSIIYILYRAYLVLTTPIQNFQYVVISPVIISRGSET